MLQGKERSFLGLNIESRKYPKWKFMNWMNIKISLCTENKLRQWNVLKKGFLCKEYILADLKNLLQGLTFEIFFTDREMLYSFSMKRTTLPKAGRNEQKLMN